MKLFDMKKIFIFFIYVVGILTFKAQGRIDKAIQNLEQNYTQEKVYVLLDKDNYVVGDNIYFKSFVFDGYRRSTISNTLFVELYDHNKNLVDKRTIALKNGEGDGSFVLTEALKEDIYFFRAYTAWMANFPEEFNFIKPVPIYNPKSEQKLVLDKNIKWTANAFPESGTFIENINTKIAVRLFSQGIPPASWSGYIIDAEKPAEKLVSFKGFDQNVSAFNLTPKAGKTYKVIVEDNKGTKQTIALPAVSNSGVNLQIASDNDGINYALKSNNLAEGLKGHSIVGIINNQMVYRANIKNTSAEISSKIPTKISDDKNAVLQLVIFNDKEEVVAKRLCFVKPKNLIIEQPTFVSMSLNNDPRSFNSFELEPDTDYPSYTVLVKENTKTESTNDNNILSALWLTGDFPSSIFSPARYFSKNANTDALDALLISESWKRFDWDSLLAGKTPEIKYKPESNLSFKGKVTNNGRAIPNKSVNLLFNAGGTDKGISQAITDDNGFIYLNNIYFDEPLTVSYYLNQEKNKASESDNVNIYFQPLTNNIIYKSNLPPTNYRLVDPGQNSQVGSDVAKALQNKKNQQILKTANEETLIEEVKVTAKKVDLKEKLDKELSSGRFSSMNATIFDLVNENQDAQASLNIMQWLQGRAAGLTFTMDNSGNYVPSIRGSQAKLFLDEMPVDASMINSLPVSNIAMVKILKNDGLVGDAVAIYTKRGNMLADQKDDKKEQTNKTILRGYDKATEFEQPDITSDAYRKVEKDTRELLYWNPNLTPESGLPARAIFFNNDEAKNREITIISFDKDDKLLYYNEVK
ncbi:hypothetical protein SAMN05421825_2704 [Epilithonimonas hungarica]|uniref:TonB-dependent Receptor Plug Domain n=2 Tax=Epilithonimonas hungarica TaxID=454006 RepID=A0A1G7RL75_9FLAO|nr:hypothetical protein SAMN05421825_2704 [Epilithonimonas hungarica]